MPRVSGIIYDEVARKSWAEQSLAGVHGFNVDLLSLGIDQDLVKRAEAVAASRTAERKARTAKPPSQEVYTLLSSSRCMHAWLSARVVSIITGTFGHPFLRKCVPVFGLLRLIAFLAQGGKQNVGKVGKNHHRNDGKGRGGKKGEAAPSTPPELELQRVTSLGVFVAVSSSRFIYVRLEGSETEGIDGAECRNGTTELSGTSSCASLYVSQWFVFIRRRRPRERCQSS